MNTKSTIHDMAVALHDGEQILFIIMMHDSDNAPLQAAELVMTYPSLGEEVIDLLSLEWEIKNITIK